MKVTRYYIHSLPSMVGGGLAVGGAIALLTRDALQTGVTLEHALMPVLVGLTVLFGHEAWRALKEAKLISFVAFVVLAIFGSSIIVTETMGRRAETRDAKVNAATKTVDEYAALLANLDRANKLASEAESWVAHECRTGLGPKCRGVTFTFEQRKAHAEKLRKDAEAHKAPPPVDSKADRVGAVAAVFGMSAKDAVKAFQTFDPFTLALFFELGAIFGFGFGVKCRKVREPVEAKAIPVEAPKALSFENENGDRPKEEVDELKRLFGRVAKILTENEDMDNQDLAEKFGVSPGHMSRIRKALEEAGYLSSEKIGKRVFARVITRDGVRVAA
jgi:DNA-binding transcriptional ArsR family regulator